MHVVLLPVMEHAINQNLKTHTHKTIFRSVASRRGKRYKLMITSRTNHSGDAIKNITKTSVNPTSMKVGICAIKSLWMAELSWKLTARRTSSC
jgi:hypothetical protein